MPRSSSFLLFCALWSIPGVAMAGSLVVPPLVGADAKAVMNVTSMIASEASFMPNIDEVIELDAVPSTLNASCLGSTSCLSAITKSKAGNGILAGTLSTTSTEYTLDLVYYDAATNKLVRRKTFKLAASSEAVADGMNAIIKEMLTGSSPAALAAAQPSVKDFAAAADDDDFSFEEDKPKPASPAARTATTTAKPATTTAAKPATTTAAKPATTTAKPASATTAKPASDDEFAFDDDFAFDEEDARQSEEERAAEAAKAKAAETARLKAEATAKAKTEADAKAKAEAEAKAKADAEARRREEETARARAAETARLEAEAAAKAKLEADAKAKADAAARARAQAAAEEEAEEEARLAAERKAAAARTAAVAAKPTAEEDEFDPNEFSFGSAAGKIESVDDISFAPSTPTPPPRTTTAATTRSTTPAPATSGSSRSYYADEDEDAPPPRTTAPSTARTSAREDDEDAVVDLDDDERPSTRTPTRSSDLDKPGGSSRETTTIRKPGAKSDFSRVQIMIRAGYSKYYDFDFVTAGGELAIGAAKHVYILAGIETYNVQRAVPENMQVNGRLSEWNTIYPINAGLVYKGGEGKVHPYIGADVILAPYYFDTNGQASWATGGRVRGGVDLMVADNFGFNFNVGVGAWHGADWAIVQRDTKATGILPQVNAGTVIAF